MTRVWHLFSWVMFCCKVTKRPVGFWIDSNRCFAARRLRPQLPKKAWFPCSWYELYLVWLVNLIAIKYSNVGQVTLPSFCFFDEPAELHSKVPTVLDHLGWWVPAANKHIHRRPQERICWCSPGGNPPGKDAEGLEHSQVFRPHQARCPGYLRPERTSGDSELHGRFRTSGSTWTIPRQQRMTWLWRRTRRQSLELRHWLQLSFCF